MGASDEKILRLSATEISEFKLCRELHRLRWVLRLEPVDYSSKAMEAGKGLHGALDLYRTTGMLEPAFDHLSSTTDGYELAAAQATVAGYAARWEHDGLEWLAVEKYFAVLQDGYALHGKVDGIARDKSGKVCVVETKSTSQDVSPGSMYWVTLTIDDQIGIYLPGARELGFQPEYVLYDVIRRPAVEPKEATPVENRKYRKGDGQLYANQREHDESVFDYRSRVIEHIEERPLEYFARERLVRLEDEEKSQRREMLRIVNEMRTTYDDPQTPAPKSPGACRRFGRLCEYVDLCNRRDTPDSANWKRNLETTTEKPEAKSLW